MTTVCLWRSCSSNLLKARAIFDYWSDRQITSGQEWRLEIEKALSSAKTAVLLVSPAFLASPFIAENELAPLLRSAKAGDLKILWIPVRPSNVDHTEIAAFQAAHPPGRPLAALGRAPREQALVRISQEIMLAATTADAISTDASSRPSEKRLHPRLLAAVGIALFSFLALGASWWLLNKPSSRFLPPDPDARERYLEGLEQLARFNASQARRSFEAVLAKGEFPPARSARAEALLRLGYHDAADSEAKAAFREVAKVPLEERLQIEARFRRILAGGTAHDLQQRRAGLEDGAAASRSRLWSFGSARASPGPTH